MLTPPASSSTCPVCLEEQAPESMCTLRCKHHVCSTCLGKLRAPTCPICRVHIFENQSTDSEDDEDEQINVHEYATALLRELEMQTAPESSSNEPDEARWSPGDELTVFAHNVEEQRVVQVPLEEVQRYFLRGHRQRRLRRRRNQIQRAVNDAVDGLVANIMDLV